MNTERRCLSSAERKSPQEKTDMTKRKSKPQPKTFNPHHQELVSLFHHPGINVFPTPNIGLALAHLPCCETAGVKHER